MAKTIQEIRQLEIDAFGRQREVERNPRHRRKARHGAGTSCELDGTPLPTDRHPGVEGETKNYDIQSNTIQY